MGAALDWEYASLHGISAESIGSCLSDATMRARVAGFAVFAEFSELL
jgi:hypothetical protein